MKRTLVALLICSLLPSVASAQTQTKMRSPSLVLAGLITLVGGLSWATPTGETYRVLDSPYCVTQYAVDAGACSVSSTRRQIALFAAAGGATLMVIGLTRVKVAPTPTGVGASATIQWGH